MKVRDCKTGVIINMAKEDWRGRKVVGFTGFRASNHTVVSIPRDRAEILVTPDQYNDEFLIRTVNRGRRRGMGI